MLRLSILLPLLFPLCAIASPLTIYDQTDLGGTGTPIPLRYSIYSDSEIPNDLNDRISSFRLEAGHMAVVSDLGSGLGPGKTYIADQEDLIVSALPEELDNAVSFIRVVPWRSSNKKGTGGDLSDEPSVDASWYYRWSRDIGEGQALGEREYVPMSWGAGGARDEALPDYLAMDQVTHILGFNESDNCFDQSGQYGDPKLCNVPTAVDFYKNLQRVGLRLGSPATREEGAQNTNGWLNQFMTQAEAADIRIDFVALHWYDWESQPKANPVVPASQIFRRFKRYLSNAYHRHRRPLWITEFNANINRATDIQNEFLQLALPYLESIGYVERYAYFQPLTGTGDFFENGQLTSTGEIYRDQVSTLSYTPNKMPSIWESQDVGNVGLPGTTIHAGGTFTVCGSGSGIGGIADEFHYMYTPLNGDGSIIVHVDAILQRGDSKAGLMIRETLDTGSKHASMLLTEYGQARFEHRSSMNGSTGATIKSIPSGPYWLKLERQGDVITGSYSNDAENWTTLSEQTITLSEDVHVGLAVSSQNDTNFCDTIFKSLSVSSVSDDSDNDQLPDQWELNFFKNLTTSEGGTGNYDGDSNTDFEEYIVGTDPTDPRSFFSSTPTNADNGFLEITFPGVAGLTYTLEVSNDLSPGSWNTVNSISPSSDGPQLLNYTQPDSPSALFGRIKAEN